MEKVTIQELIKINKEELKGKIIAFPTDTVYGVGSLYGDEVGIEKIYQMKKRDYGKPLPVLCANLSQVKEIAIYKEEMDKYSKLWPGALTIILNGKKSKTIAVRIPNSLLALKLLETFGPLSTTSVNYSGEKEINTVEEIESKFSKFLDYLIIDKGDFSKVPSTIIDLTTDSVKVLRQGSIKI